MTGRGRAESQMYAHISDIREITGSLLEVSTNGLINITALALSLTVSTETLMKQKWTGSGGEARCFKSQKGSKRLAGRSLKASQSLSMIS